MTNIKLGLSQKRQTKHNTHLHLENTVDKKAFIIKTPHLLEAQLSKNWTNNE